MKIQFLGTGAAEGIPAAYCRCEACEGVRKRGGVEIRSRSSIRIDDEYQIDISPDYYLQMIQHGIDMYDVRHLLITHSHEDHLSLSAITDKTMSQVVNGDPLSIYISKPGYAFVKQFIDVVSLPEPHSSRLDSMLDLHVLDYEITTSIGKFRAETVSGNHKAFGENEKSINYLLTDTDGATLLYALDTGYYTDETYEYLTGKRADAVIMDCTFAGRTDRGEFPFGHLDQASFLRQVERMSAIGFIDSNSRIFATHFNPHQGLTHYEIQERFDASPFEVTVAYDGLKIEVTHEG